MPKEYVKSKNIEKKIYQAHKQLYGLNEVEAKVRYTGLARSLKTYGITFFLVKVYRIISNRLHKSMDKMCLCVCVEILDYIFEVFFQEKLKGTKRLVPRLFGVNKEAIVRVDEKTKEILRVCITVQW